MTCREPSSRPGRLGNINPIPIDYGFRPRLRGPANPARIDLAQEPLDFRREGFSPSLTLLMSAFALPIPPRSLTAPASPAYGTLRYHSRRQRSEVRYQNCRDAGRRASGRSLGTRPASARLSPRRHSQDRDSKAPIPASRPQNRLPSPQTGGTPASTDAAGQSPPPDWRR